MVQRSDTADYRALFLNDAPLMDVRAPAEFSQGAFPNASSLPLLSDDERAQVGICYKQRGQAAAIELGHTLVSGAARRARLAQWAGLLQQGRIGVYLMNVDNCLSWISHPAPSEEAA